MKDELGGIIVKEFVAPRSKIYSYNMDNGHVDKRAKCAKNVSSNEILTGK